VSPETLTDRDELAAETRLPPPVAIEAGELRAPSRRSHRLRPRRRRIVLLLAALVAAVVGARVVDGTVFSRDGETTRLELQRVPDRLGTGPDRLDPIAATVIARYRARVPELMAEQGIPGLAVALVDKDQALWVEGFGHLDRPGSDPVNADTVFSAQSMSKLFTATAVMQAVAAGRLDLDEPITTYLPWFTVHSAFEEHAERKITLRMLLGHTAGFTHEAPVGNNNELDPGDFDAHVRSISDTWLRFPVGTGYAYSNLGIDLAGYILARVEGVAFPKVMRQSLLEPLGMERSTFDRTAIRSADNRATGHLHPYPEPPLDVPMTAAGGLYTSAADLALFLRFQLNGGSLDGRVVLGRKWLDEMQTVQPPHAGEPAGYALGVVRHRWNTWPDLLEHGGGGYGFLSDLWWVPEVGIGIAVLTNSQDHQLQNELALSILADLLREPGAYRDRLLALPWRAPVEDPNLSFEPPAGMASFVANAAMDANGDEANRWAVYAGLYRAPEWGVLAPEGPRDRFFVDAGVPYFEAEDDTESLVRHRLAEIKPGLFLADNGETLDLRGQVPTWQNLRLARVSGGPSPWQWAILGAAGLLAATWLVAALARTVRRCVGRRSSADQGVATPPWRWVTAAVAGTTALLMLATVALLVWKPGLVDAGFLAWLDLSLAERLILHLPLAVVVLGASTAALVGAGWLGDWWSRAVRLQYAGLAGASVALVALLAGWDLVGWGMT
jgi:CubicO group peptidase (beta-lactamase class C family)